MNPHEIIEGAKILIVDDIQENIRLLGTLLRNYKVKISVAQNGKQAVASAKSVLPDLILMDVNMPEMDGFEAASIISKDEDTSHIPILFLTAMSEITDVVKGFELGGVDYVTKPFEAKILVSRIAAHLERKFQKEKLEEFNIKLKKSNDDMTKFLSMVAHDLKSPFSGILGLIKILDDDFDTLEDEEKKEFIGALNGSLKSQYAFMENLLRWGRLQMNDTKLNVTEFAGEVIIRNVAEVFKLNAENKNIQLNPNINVVSGSIKGDMNQLQTVIHNLTSNALKYTPSGGTIDITLNEKEELFHFSVKDSGIGMPEEIAESLFSVNKMRSRPGTDNEPGTGLGLVLCSEIVAKHSGKIWVETEENKGTTFHFEIPKEQ